MGGIVRTALLPARPNCVPGGHTSNALAIVVTRAQVLCGALDVLADAGNCRVSLRVSCGETAGSGGPIQSTAPGWARLPGRNPSAVFQPCE